jgi:hypothetical protein
MRELQNDLTLERLNRELARKKAERSHILQAEVAPSVVELRKPPASPPPTNEKHLDDDQKRASPGWGR